MLLNKNIEDRVKNVSLRYNLFLEKYEKITEKKFSFITEYKIFTYIICVFFMSIFLGVLFDNGYLILPSLFALPLLSSILLIKDKFKNKILKSFSFKNIKKTPLKMRLFNRYSGYNKEGDKLFEEFLKELDENDRHIFMSIIIRYKSFYKSNPERVLSLYLGYYINNNSKDKLYREFDTINYLIKNIECDISRDYINGLLIRKLDIDLSEINLIKKEKEKRIINI